MLPMTQARAHLLTEMSPHKLASFGKAPQFEGEKNPSLLTWSFNQLRAVAGAAHAARAAMRIAGVEEPWRVPQCFATATLSE